MDLRREQVVLETDRHRIEGYLTLPSEGYRSRLSDFLNARDREFLTVLEAKLTTFDGGGEETEPVVMVARRHVRIVTPLSGADD